MGRTARDNRDMPHPKPVEKIQLSEGNVGRRLIAAAVVLVIGGAALAYAFTQLMTPETGWRAIEASTTAGANCGDEFVFLYELGADGAAPSVENRAVSALYTDTCRTLFRLFHTVESFEGITNLRDISLHPNETLAVDAALYRAFEKIQGCGDRTLYLGPVYARYGDLFYCQDDAQLVDFDPYLSNAVREEYRAVSAYACDPQAIDLRLLGDGKVCLYVSQEYMAYAEREGIECFLDFGWMINAFIADELAKVMVDNGYTHGSISSYDGFSRNLDNRGLAYNQNVFDLVDGVIYPAGTMQYSGSMSIVYLRDYPMGDMDSRRIYQLKNGEVRTGYLDPANGLCKSAAHDLICYSQTLGCAEIALQTAPIYVAEALDIRALETLADSGIQSVRCEGRVIRGTDPGLTVTGLYETDGVSYTVSTG